MVDIGTFTTLDNDDTVGYDQQLLEYTLPAGTKGTSISLYIGDPYTSAGIANIHPTRDNGISGDIKIEAIEVIYRTKPIK